MKKLQWFLKKQLLKKSTHTQRKHTKNVLYNSTSRVVQFEYNISFDFSPFGGWIPSATNLSLCVIGKTTASINCDRNI